MFLVAASLLALATLFALSEVAGFDAVWDRMQHVQPIWFLVAFGAEIVAYLGYVFGYREVSLVDEGPKMGHGRAAAMGAVLRRAGRGKSARAPRGARPGRGHGGACE